jgi:hypothetical protein
VLVCEIDIFTKERIFIMLKEEKDWDLISRTPGLSEEYIRENSNQLYWGSISEYQTLSEEIIKENSCKVNWFLISRFQKLSESFIREFSNKVNWSYISMYQKLSEEFIREFSDKVNWRYISYYQKLNEKFIKENIYKVDWYGISIYQKLSEEFILEFSNKVNWNCIAKHQKLNPEFIKEYFFKIPETCWLYKDKEFKREYIKKHTSYEIIGDKVIAYKTCRLDGYSVYNFQYHYEVGGEYECHTDCNVNDENSFGLSAWIKEMALDYYSKGKLFKVEIDLEDIAAIVNNSNKIRASKIKILEEIN